MPGRAWASGSGTDGFDGGRHRHRPRGGLGSRGRCGGRTAWPVEAGKPLKCLGLGLTRCACRPNEGQEVYQVLVRQAVV